MIIKVSNVKPELPSLIKVTIANSTKTYKVVK